MQKRFSVRDLLVAVACFAVAAGCYKNAFDHFMHPQANSGWSGLFGFIQLIASGPLLTMGLLAPLHRIRLGAYIGFFGQLIVYIGIGIYMAGWSAVWAEPMVRFILAAVVFVLSLGLFSLCRSAYRQIRDESAASATSKTV